MKRLLLLVLAAVAAGLVGLAVAACGGDDTGADDELTIVLDWFPNPDHAGLYAGIDGGDFADEGLTVNPQVPSDPSAALKQVGAGRAELAISYQPTILQARDEGIPVVATGAIVGQPLNSIIAREDRGIRRPRDLEGKKVGWPGIPINRPFLDTAVRADGGDPSKVDLQSVGFGLTPALASGRVDAIIGAYWNIELVELEKRDVAANVFRLQENGVPNYDELVVVASEKVLEENPDVVRRFLAGLAAGQERAAEDPEFATQAVLNANPDLEEGVTAEQVDITVPLLTQEGEEPLSLEPAAWAEFATWMQENDLLGEVDVDAAVTDEYLPSESSAVDPGVSPGPTTIQPVAMLTS